MLGYVVKQKPILRKKRAGLGEGNWQYKEIKKKTADHWRVAKCHSYVTRWIYAPTKLTARDQNLTWSENFPSPPSKPLLQSLNYKSIFCEVQVSCQSSSKCHGLKTTNPRILSYFAAGWRPSAKTIWSADWGSCHHLLYYKAETDRPTKVIEKYQILDIVGGNEFPKGVSGGNLAKDKTALRVECFELLFVKQTKT